MKQRHHLWLWGLYGILIIIFLFLLFLNFYPVRDTFERSIVESTKIYDRNGILLYETLHPEQGKTTKVSLDQISKYLIQATIAVEDQNFYENSGIDFGGILRAVFLNVKEGQVVSGGSTITQQLVRNVIGINHERTFFQKIKESLLALRVAKVFTKDEVLRMYFNKIYYGNLNYGVSAASQGYFGKQVSDLDLAESAFLAGLPQAPNRYDPFKHHDDALKRKNYVLSLMQKNGYISDSEAAETKKEELKFEQNLITVKAPHFVRYIIDELEQRYGESYASGWTVKTTLDYSTQEKVQEIAVKNISELAGRNVTNASVVVLEAKTGDILAMLGSVDYFDENIDGQVNIATSPRQPGSAMKPITYAVAFEKGWNGATLIKDEPTRFFTADGLPYLPKNYDYEYHGTVTVREALANSFNIPAIKTIDFAGVQAVLEKAHEMGITTLNQSADYYGLALTLGDAEVKLLDLTSVYMVFANKGLQKDPRAITEIQDSKGNVIFKDYVSPGKRVLSEDISFMVTDILADNSARIPEFGLNSVLEIDRPAAVKTGTTRNFKDNWTLGFTPDFVVGTWVGNSDGSQMHDVSGVYGAGPIWHDVMMEIHRGKEKKQFTPPLGVEKKEFCTSVTLSLSKGGDGNNERLCEKRISEWIPKKSQFLNDDQQAKEIPKLRIKNPFDLDTYQFNPNIDTSVQQIKFKAEKDNSVGEVSWYVNGSLVGKGDEIFWSIAKGEFEIQAKAKDGVESEAIKIAVE